MFDYPYECSKWFGDLIRQRDRTITEEQIKTFEETLRGYLNECMHTSYNFIVSKAPKGAEWVIERAARKAGINIEIFRRPKFELRQNEKGETIPFLIEGSGDVYYMKVKS
jgi:hypothetical protein